MSLLMKNRYRAVAGHPCCSLQRCHCRGACIACRDTYTPPANHLQHKVRPQFDKATDACAQQMLRINAPLRNTIPDDVLFRTDLQSAQELSLKASKLKRAWDLSLIPVGGLQKHSIVSWTIQIWSQVLQCRQCLDTRSCHVGGQGLHSKLDIWSIHCQV